MLGGGAVGIKGDNPRKLEYNPHSQKPMVSYGCINPLTTGVLYKAGSESESFTKSVFKAVSRV